MSNEVLLGIGTDAKVACSLRMANRHGLIAGATGTGKTVSLQVLAEGFSRAGVPVFLADVKGDLGGLAAGGGGNAKVDARVRELKLAWQPRANPVVFWDLYGKNGHPIRGTISDMGPLLLANLLELNDVQSGVLSACFKIADDQGLLLLDFKDLKALLAFAADNAKTLQRDYGNLSTTSLAAIQRNLLGLQQQNADNFFGEPALKLIDLMPVDFSGNGVVSILDATQLMASPRLYSTFLLWLLSELFEELPEVGDVDKPKLVFFFDEAHLLFNNAPKVLLEKIEQVVRLIRSKGVGIYFISQNPADIPDSVLGQLGLRIQHALRAFTPKDQKAVKVAAQTFRPNPALDVESAITALGVGEALVSVLDESGTPTPVERVLMVPPESRVGPLNEAERRERIARSPLAGRYDQTVDRESAYEVLKQRAESRSEGAASGPTSAKPVRSVPEDLFATMAKSAVRAVGSRLGQEIVRGVLGSILGTSSRRRR